MNAATTTPSRGNWSAERIAGLTRAEVETLKENAQRKGAEALAELCNADLQRRGPSKSRTASKQLPGSAGEIVTEFHFVCARDLGVTLLDGGQRFKSGSWVVDEDVVVTSLNHGALLALHESKAEPSYRQGRIVGFARTARSMVPDSASNKVPTGIEFEVEATDAPLDWQGAGAGEKGYRRVAAPTSATASTSLEGKK